MPRKSRQQLIAELHAAREKKAIEMALLKKRGIDPDVWDHPVVGIDEFIESPEYLGHSTNFGKAIYPYWREVLREIFAEDAEYYEAIFSGSIGIGKSTIANLGLVYMAYRLLCLKNPQKYYGLMDFANIVILLFNLSLKLVESVGYLQIQDMMMKSPFFMSEGEIRGLKHKYMIYPKKKIEFTLGTTQAKSGFLGRNVFAGILDEISEEKQEGRIFRSNTRGQASKALKAYTSVKRRITSRFLQSSGKIPGTLFLVSSTQEDQAFLQQYIGETKNDSHVYVSEPSQWEVKWYLTDSTGNRRYSGEFFHVAVGDARRQSVIIEDDTEEERAKYLKLNYGIIEVPVEHRTEFDRDINSALRELAGIANESSSKLIPYPDKIDSIFDNSKASPTGREVFQAGLTRDNFSFTECITEEGRKLLAKDLHKPRFLHIDIGLTNDRVGLAAVHIKDKVEVTRFTETQETYKDEANVYEVDLLLNIKAVVGDEISLDRISEFIFWLRDFIGWKIGHVSFDQYQSRNLVQRMINNGIESKTLSLDKDDVPYLELRTTILESRLVSYYHSVLQFELQDLLHDRESHKVDHSSTGSKDLADGLCGAVYDAMINAKIDRSAEIKRAQEIVQELVKELATEKKADPNAWLYYDD